MKNFENLGRILSKAEQKNILGGNLVLCGGEGNYPERCSCYNSSGALIGPFYCCHNGESACLTENCGNNYGGGACAKVTG